MNKPILIIFIFALTFPVAAKADAFEWMLFGREGTCVPIATAADRMPILKDITHPDELVARLRDQGEAVNVKRIVDHKYSPRIISAPGRGLSLIFAPKTECLSIDDGPD